MVAGFQDRIGFTVAEYGDGFHPNVATLWRFWNRHGMTIGPLPQSIHVSGSHGVDGTRRSNNPIPEQDASTTKSAHGAQIMADKKYGPPSATNVLHFANTFLLEQHVADGEDFVDEEDFGFEVSGDGEGEAHAHAAAVMLEGRVDEALDFGESDDLVEFADDFGFAHAEDGSAEENVFAAGQFRMEAGADFEEAGDAAVEFGVSHSGPRDAREQLEQRGFARAVSADQADDFALLDFEGNVADGPDEVLRLAPAIRAKCVGEHVAKRTIAFALADAVALADSFDANDGVSHRYRPLCISDYTTSATVLSIL